MSKKARFSVIFIMTVFFLSLGLMAAGEDYLDFCSQPGGGKTNGRRRALKKRRIHRHAL